MRIQHNIMAMNAYRNFGNNTSALSKNLEKLSSGYKINRAGDDAAGLAISEKMRAQITGLNAAQKNVKDGISLVKTAEGALQEVHDMLNRMDYLATQSANGTYDDPVDRANLQKEVVSLKAEINRISDSANFNGKKLLNGSLKDGATVDVTVSGSNNGQPITGTTDFTQGWKDGDTLTINGVTYKCATKADEANNVFAVNDFKTKVEKAAGVTLANGKVTATGKSLTLQIGDTSQGYDQLNVEVGDLDTVGLGIDDLDIGTVEGAQQAIDKIKAAINSVSGTRGDLGAIQNRLEHTQNNLSVMTENIQDAESTIRDTDVAEEMMAYTQNTILIQSAQAMLAQANQVPQGVLQLMQ